MRNGVVVRQKILTTTTSGMKYGQLGRILNGEFEDHVIVRLEGCEGFVSLNNTKLRWPDGTVFAVEILEKGTEVIIIVGNNND